MEFKTIEQWDEQFWQKVSFIYHEAFAGKGAKPEKIIRNMFRKQLCFLHVAVEEEKVIAMAITGKLSRIQALLVDYLAVNNKLRNQGIGLKMMEYIKEWALKEGNFKSIIIEVESENNPENNKRIHFWKKCGFTLTNYIHHYIWVPETYQAMYVKLLPEEILPENGEELFKYIGQFHKSSFQTTN